MENTAGFNPLTWDSVATCGDSKGKVSGGDSLSGVTPPTISSLDPEDLLCAQILN